MVGADRPVCSKAVSLIIVSIGMDAETETPISAEGHISSKRLEKDLGIGGVMGAEAEIGKFAKDPASFKGLEKDLRLGGAIGERGRIDWKNVDCWS